MKKFTKITILFSIIVLSVVMFAGCEFLEGKGEFVVKEHLDDVIVEINDTKLTFRDIGYYIANGEAAVEAQALVYNPDNPEEYWNKHTNGIFIKVQTRENIMDNFIRDTVLAMSAKEQGLSLSDEEKENCVKTAKDLYGQLSAFQREEAGITEETLVKDIENAYLGQKYIEYRLENDGRDDYTQEDWILGGVCYEGLLSKYDVKVITDTWEQAELGTITIER